MKKAIVFLCFFGGAACFISAGLYINKNNAGMINTTQESVQKVKSPELLSDINMTQYVSLPASFSDIDIVEDMTPKLTKEQAVGVLVNIMHESDFNYTATEHSDGSGGYGLVQWTGGRRTNLVTWCNNNGVKYNTLEGQCKFLEYEFSSSAVWTNSGVNGFLQCSSAYDAGRYFLKYFERPAAKYEAQREASLNQDIATIESML